jgi:ABC-type dipeptide/oligopeptide/nickel transport system ATPase component
MSTPITTPVPADRAPDQESLRIRSLGLSIEGTQILKDIDLDVPSGKVTGLAGESGSGKTMTGMAVMRLQPEEAVVTGRIEYHGTNLLDLTEKQMAAQRGRHIAMVFQDPTASLHPMITIGGQLTDHMRHHLHLSKKEATARALDLLRQVRVPDPENALSRYPHQFSGGQLQRIAISIAIACHPDLLIADEPTTALDVTVQAGILRLLRTLCDDTGLTIVLVTHDLGVMSALADNIAVMRNGEIVEHGTRYDIIRHPEHPYTRALIDSLPKNMMARRAAAAAELPTEQAR